MKTSAKTAETMQDAESMAFDLEGTAEFIRQVAKRAELIYEVQHFLVDKMRHDPKSDEFAYEVSLEVLKSLSASLWGDMEYAAKLAESGQLPPVREGRVWGEEGLNKMRLA